MNDRHFVNEVLGLGLVYTTIRDWETCTETAGQLLNGYNVARFLQGRYTLETPSPPLWRAVARVADDEINIQSRKPENLVAALVGLDDNLR